MGFRERLRERREELKMTQAELAERIGVTKSTVGNYETGVSAPREDVLMKLVTVLDVDPNYLYQDAFTPKGFLYTPTERRLVERYRGMTAVGKRAADTVIDALSSAGLARAVTEQERRPPQRRIPLYCSPAAAGYAAPVFGSEYEWMEVTQEVPPSALFAVRIQGDSMEPQIHDRSVVYVNRDPLAEGDVGIFCVDGDILCKQYYKDPMGIVYLFSLNRARADADVVFSENSGRTLACFGKVILPRRLPLPGK